MPFRRLVARKVHCCITAVFHAASKRNRAFLHECPECASRRLVDPHMIGITEIAVNAPGGGGEGTRVTGRMDNWRFVKSRSNTGCFVKPA